MKTRATERQNIKMTSRNEVDRGQEESQRTTAMLQILQYHITRLDNWKRTTSPFVYKNFVHAPITLVKNVLQMTLKTTVTGSEVNVHVSLHIHVNHRCYLNIQANSVKYGNRWQRQNNLRQGVVCVL